MPTMICPKCNGSCGKNVSKTITIKKKDGTTEQVTTTVWESCRRCGGQGNVRSD
ncbi:hypothetical protein ACIBG8_54425 [Nonomuraea sp. NPDC050556]|uniref:hypothetical protein n=1 Tax=Nonomuraea sp. NPDC050556 TaxID=3364369 RepID=UPI003787DAAC